MNTSVEGVPAQAVYGDMTMEVSSIVLEDHFKADPCPIYTDCRGISRARFDYVTHWPDRNETAPS
jgi:hypothetical protein